jgi:maleate isomerase
MERPAYPCELATLPEPRFGLVALQSDETVERDLRLLLPAHANLMVSRVPSGEEVTPETLAAMEAHLAQAASLFPSGAPFDVIGYGCTSGAAQIGREVVAARIAGAVRTAVVTEPLTGLIDACAHLGLRRLAILSPYVAQVSERLRAVLAAAGIETPLLGSFEIATEAIVVRIAPHSIMAAARDLMRGAAVDGLFLSCTNLRALEIIAPLEAELRCPVLCSNQVLAWHMMRAAACAPPESAPGRLFDPRG